MKPEEMRDDIPMDVREALARHFESRTGAVPLAGLPGTLIDIIRAKPRTVHLCEADLPAPLEEVPERGTVWAIVPWAATGVKDYHVSSAAARQAVASGAAWADREDAMKWRNHLQSWRPHRPGGVDWTPHTPGDPMPCDRDALVDVRFRDGSVVRRDHADHYCWQRLDEDRPHDFDIIAWRYAREES